MNSSHLVLAFTFGIILCLLAQAAYMMLRSYLSRRRMQRDELERLRAHEQASFLTAMPKGEGSSMMKLAAVGMLIVVLASIIKGRQS